jgi:hypothetical protein
MAAIALLGNSFPVSKLRPLIARQAQLVYFKNGSKIPFLMKTLYLFKFHFSLTGYKHSLGHQLQ